MESQVIEDLLAARVASGLGRPELGAAIGLSPAEIGRIERHERASLTFDDVARLAAGVGLRLHVRLFPDADPVRDAGQVRVLERFRRELPSGLRCRVEVPLPGPADLRAWDGQLDGHGCVDAIEAETRFVDEQATVRRITRKLRDDPRVRHVILLLPETPTNRAALRATRAGLRDTFPLDTREAMARLRVGRCPGANAIVVL